MSNELPPTMKREDSTLSDSKSSFGYKRTATGLSQRRQRNNAATAHQRTMAQQSAEAVPEPKEIHNWLVYMVGLSMCMSAMAYGYDTGFFGGTLALQSFQDDFGDTTTSKATMVSLFKAGSFFGTALQLPFTEAYGRKKSVALAIFIFIASAFPQIFAAGSVAVFTVGRFFGGFAVGMLYISVPIYLAEFSPASVRGRFLSFFDILQAVGSLLGFWINYIIQGSMESNRFQWQLPVFVQLFPAAMLVCILPWLPESPRWLIIKGRDQQAMKNLCYLRRLPEDHSYVQYEFNQTKEQVEAEKAVRGEASIWRLVKELFTIKSPRRRVTLGLIIIGFKSFSGINAINYYGPQIFRQLGFIGTRNALFANGVYGSVRFVFTVIFGLFIVDRIGRRRPLIFGAILLSSCLFFIGLYLTITGVRQEGEARQAGDYVAITAIFVYAAGYSFGWNSLPLTLVAEIFSIRLRVISMTICIMFQWITEFAIQQITPHALDNITTKTYFIFSSVFIWASVFGYFFVPETKQISLENMDRLFGGGEGGENADVEHAMDHFKQEEEAVENIHQLNSHPGLTKMAPVSE